MALPSYIGREKPTRDRSAKQEKRLAKSFGGRTTSNSGAKFGENDIKTPDFEIEAKTTYAKQFPLKLETLKSAAKKCPFEKIPLLIVEFDGGERKDEYVIIERGDFITLTGAKDL